MFKFEKVDYQYKNANGKKALYGINFEIKEKVFTGIAGPVGSGKTTLSFLLSGLFNPSTGNVRFKNRIINKEISQNKIWREIGLIQQQPENQIFETNVLSEVSFALKNAGIKQSNIEWLVIDALKKVGLDESFITRSPFKLSGGEKKQVAIASIIAYDPSVLIFDEPTAGLDRNAKMAIHSYIESIKGEKTIILISHDPNELILTEELLLLSDGCLVKKSKTKEVILKEFSSLGLPFPDKWQFLSRLKNCGFDLGEDDDIPKLVRTLEEKYGLI